MPLFLVGCDGASEEAAVSGIVTLDGDPLDCGTVVFVAGSQSNVKAATGSIQSDGSYQVQIGQSGKLWVGEYEVKISAREPSTPHPEGGPPIPGVLLTPEHYAKTATSGLRYNIRAGENTIDIALVSDPVETAAEEAALSEGDAASDGSSEKSADSPTEEPAEILQEASAAEASAE